MFPHEIHQLKWNPQYDGIWGRGLGRQLGYERGALMGPLVGHEGLVPLEETLESSFVLLAT